MSRWLGLDIGEKRIGVAICDETHTLARPLLTITRASKIEDFTRIAAVCGEHQIERIIAGLPKTLRNEEGLQALFVRRYVDKLHAVVNIPIEFWDERFSSMEAGERLAISSRKPRRKGDIDAAAAAIILQEYLDAQCTMINDTGGRLHDYVTTQLSH